jgi:hypothetical protein
VGGKLRKELRWRSCGRKRRDGIGGGFEEEIKRDEKIG